MRVLGTHFRKMMYDYYINVCEDLLIKGKTEDIDSLTGAIKDRYIIKRDDGSFFVTVPAFNMEQIKKFNEIAEKHLHPLMKDYCKVVNNFVAEYKNLFPKHLSDDVDRLCQGVFLGMCPYIIAYGQRNGIFTKPSDPVICDVIIQEK